MVKNKDSDDYYHICSQADDEHILDDELPECPNCKTNAHVSDKTDHYLCKKCGYKFY